MTSPAVRAGSAVAHARGPSSPGIISELVSFYRAIGVAKEGSGGGVGGEEITVHEVPLNEIQTWLHQREAEMRLIDLKEWGGLLSCTKYLTDDELVPRLIRISDG
jgi:hypothetical protein